METYSVEKVKEILDDIITECFGHAKAKQQPEGYIILEHRFTTIPLLGIDVPFHSTHVSYFRFG